MTPSNYDHNPSGDRHHADNDDDDDERPVRGRRGRVKKWAKLLADYDRMPGEQAWEDYVAQAEGAVSWEDFEAWQAKQGWRSVATYRYTDKNGSVLYEAVRYNYAPLPKVKKFQLRHKDSDGRWVHGAGPARVPYRLFDLVDRRNHGKPIIVCEGEKDTDNAWSKGLRATCAQGSNWSDDVTDYLIGEDVIVVPDNDKKGHENAQKAVDKLSKVARSVKILELDGLPPRGDLTDWFAVDGNTADELIALAERVDPEPIPGHLGKSFGMDAWQDQPIPEREWIVKDFIPTNAVGFIYGDGGTGKSLLGLMLTTSRAPTLPKPWLGLEVKQGKTLYISCEDDERESHLRSEDIRRHLGLQFSDLGAARMIIQVGQDTVLGESRRREGPIEPTELFRAVKREFEKHEADLLIIDSLADVFSGNENERVQVRQFVSMLGRLATRGRSVLILAHPSLSGLNTGRGTSGSTAWNNSSRFRATLERVKLEGGEEDKNLRVLSLAKSNYGPADIKITVRWEDGVYVPVDGGTVTAAMSRVTAIYWFQVLLRRLAGQGRYVSHKKGTNSAPSLFAEEPEAKERRITKRDFNEAMTALFSLGKIKAEEYGPPSKRASRLALMEPEAQIGEEPF